MSTEVLHGTTIGSNTVLEGKGARTALITTRGFRDILEIRDLRMPVLYDLHWTKPRALVERRLATGGRSKSCGRTVRYRMPLDRASVDAAIAMLRAENVQSVAICLLHSYANPAHERAVADAVRRALPDVAISVSHEILPEIKEYPRTSTTVINAYVQPVVRAYVTALCRLVCARSASRRRCSSCSRTAGSPPPSSPPSRPRTSSKAARPPAWWAARRSRPGWHEPRVITFDMGGTTAKAGLVENGEVLRSRGAGGRRRRDGRVASAGRRGLSV